ncbi:MAG: hypothetical protein QHH15_00205 [Candidatus Thermoplasmatota archaeon]|nr:hypothetical protein [Candidatus Thermoplasmatota archaeon]
MGAIPQAILDEVNALQSKNVGLVVGLEQTDIALEGSGTEWAIPEKYLPVFPRTGVSLTAIGVDVTVTDGEDVIEVDSIDEDGNMVLGESATAPTATFEQEFEPYLAQNVKVDIKQDETSVGRIRSDMKKKIYGAKEITISQDQLIGDTETLIQLAFDSYTNDDIEIPDDVEVYEMSSEPKTLSAYVILEKSGVAEGKMYFLQARCALTTLIDVKEGDIPQSSMDITVDVSPRIVRPVA